jgi:hypothetical protein
MACEIIEEYASPEDRRILNTYRQNLIGLDYDEKPDHAYLPRAVSSIPIELREEFLDNEYGLFVDIVNHSGLTPRLPVELSKVDINEVNKLNNQNIYESRFIIPFAYMTQDGRGASDGKGWEMGYSYGAKLVIPVTYKGQKINLPSIRLDFQLPIIVDGMNKDGPRLEEMLKKLQTYQIGTGKCSKHGNTLIGRDENYDLCCLKDVVSQFFDLVPVRI